MEITIDGHGGDLASNLICRIVHRELHRRRKMGAVGFLVGRQRHGKTR